MRRSNRSKFLALFLSFAFAVQLLPTMALASESTDEPLIKEAGYQDFPAYYSDSAHADNQVTHPDVVVLNEEWNGHRYWAIYTPNVMNISIYENPSIVASDDGVHWVEPEGLSNPIEPQPPNTRYHNCDADMLYNAEMDAMMAYWNWADDQAGGVGAEMRLRISYDGVHWGVPVTYEPCTPEAVYEIVDDTSDQIVYNGSWESVADDSFHGGSAHRVNDPDAYAEFAFTGTAVRWVGKKGFDYGRADVYIDEEWMGAVTIYGQEAYDVVLYAVTGLEEGDHTIRVAYNAGAFNVDYFSYSSDE